MTERSHKPRIAWVSPGAQSFSVSAYVTEKLTPYLQKAFDVVHIDESLAPLLTSTHSTFDYIFYQREDHPDVLFTNQYLKKHPGIVLIHDLYFRANPSFPIEACTQASLLLFSAERNFHEYKRNFPKDRPYIPAYYLPYPVDSDLAAIPLAKPLPNCLRLAFAGSLRVEHRLPYVLQALQTISCAKPQISFKLLWLLDETERNEAQRYLNEYQLSDIEFFSPRNTTLWQEVVTQADAIILSLFSAFGDPGPFLPISLMAGRPVVVNDFSEGAILPSNLVYKIPSGAKETEGLINFLEQCLQHSPHLRLQQEQARAFALENHSAQNIAGDLCGLLSNNSILRYSSPILIAKSHGA